MIIDHKDSKIHTIYTLNRDKDSTVYFEVEIVKFILLALFLSIKKRKKNAIFAIKVCFK